MSSFLVRPESPIPVVRPRCEYTAAAMWALATAAAALTWIYTVSFGHVGVLLAVPLFIWLLRNARIGRAPHAVLLGAAALPAWIAWFHRDYQSCPPTAADMADGNWHCGGVDPIPFLGIAVAMVVGFLVVWLLAAATRRSPT